MNEEKNDELKEPIREGLSSYLNEDVRINNVDKDDTNDIFYVGKDKGLRFKEPEVKFMNIGRGEYINVYNICSVTVNDFSKRIEKITMADGTTRTVSTNLDIKIEDLLK